MSSDSSAKATAATAGGAAGSFPEPLVRQAGQGRRIGIAGNLYRFVATGEDTDGQYAMYEALVPPGHGAPLHTHSREQEFFLVLEGEMTFRLNEDTLVGGPGTCIHIPRGCLHTFRNESDRPARMLIGLVPAGLERMILGVGQPVPDGATAAPPPTEADIQRLLAAGPSFGIDFRTG